MTEPMSEDDIKQSGLANCCPGYAPEGCWYRVEARDQERIVEVIRDHARLVAEGATMEQVRAANLNIVSEFDMLKADYDALRARDLCECGHAGYQHDQGCAVCNCDCPYFERPAPIDGSRARESVSTAGGVHDDSPDQSAAPVAPKPGQGIRIPSDSFEAYQIGYERGFQDGRNTAAAANLKQVEQVIELGPRTLRALVGAVLALQWARTDPPCRPTEVDDLLAEMARTEEK